MILNSLIRPRLTPEASPSGSARKRWSTGPALLSLLAGALLCAPLWAESTQAASEATPKQPKLVVEERVHDTGEVARDQVVEHSFKIRNDGDAPLVIENAVVGSNTEILSRPSSLAPGESGEIRVRVPLIQDRALALLKQVELRTNDPSQPSLVLELKILSKEYVVAKPGYARWIAVQKEVPGTISQKLVAPDGADFQILDISTPPAGITMTSKALPATPPAPKEWQIDLTLGTDAPVGPIVGTLLVHVNHPKQSVVPIPLSGFMRPVAAVTPPKLDIGEIELTKAGSQAFLVKIFSTEPIYITKAEHNLAGVPPAAIETMTDGRQYKVRLAFDPATTPKGPIHGTLRILTSSTKVPELTVPIDGVIK